MASTEPKPQDRSKLRTDNITGMRTEFVKELRNFSEKELTCPCCKTGGLTSKMATRLQALRDYLDKPLKVTSGYRCKKFNDSLPNAAKFSQHLLGKAVDISTGKMNSAEKSHLLKVAKAFGFKGIGVYPNHIHLDLRSGNPAKWTVTEYAS